MRREAIAPRPDWREKVEALGLVWHTAPDGRPYWNEAARYVFTAAEIGEVEAATAELYRLFLAAGQAVIDRGLYDRFGIPAWCVPLIEAAWEAEPPALNYGRFDLGYDGAGPPKLFEFNCDTPTSLLETAVVQWAWMEETAPRSGPGLDQYNSLHDKLADKWADIAPLLGGPVHLLHVADAAGEDQVTVAYHQDLARQAGLETVALTMEDVGWYERRRRFVDLQARPISTAFHLYPWEWLANERFGPHIAECADTTLWIEPIWKMLWSNKAVLPLLWEMFPGHPNLLPAYADRWPAEREGTGDHVKKPKLGREGANVTVVRGGTATEATGGDYGAEGFVMQGLFPLPDIGGVRPVLGAWIVDGEPAGMGVREAEGFVTGNAAAFVPHVIDG